VITVKILGSNCNSSKYIFIHNITNSPKGLQAHLIHF